jgi:GNAT superfamily N-acetyltransferase
MLLTRAAENEYPKIVELVNQAYRSSGAAAGWNSEADFIEGERITESLLRDDLAAKPRALLLTFRDEAQSAILGTVWLEPKAEGVWYIGLLTVRPDLQDKRLGRTLLNAAETFARARGARRMRMTVVNVRSTLIAWYERRGYRQTGETEPFPYDDERFGKPLRSGLSFVILEKDFAADLSKELASGADPACR